MYGLDKSYSELVRFESFFDRFEYLKLDGRVGEDTFGHDRYLNQRFYTSQEWRRARSQAIARDLGCDLGIADRAIFQDVVIHHINPITAEDLVSGSPKLLSMENLITTSKTTHKAIHFGDQELLVKDYTPRRPGDTKLW